MKRILGILLAAALALPQLADAQWGKWTIGGGGGAVDLTAPGPIGGTTPSTGAFTTLSASSTVSGAGFSAYLASPPAIGGTVAAAASFTTLSLAAGTLTTAVSPWTSTWTANGAVIFPGAVTNVTKTAAATGSLFADYQIGGTSALSFGFPGTNSTLGAITSPGIKLVSGADTLTLSADNNFTSTVGANNGLILAYGGNGNGVGLVAGGIPDTNRISNSPNGMTLGRFGNSVGRHGVTNNSVAGNAGFVIQPHQADDVIAGLLIGGQSAYAQATTNPSGGPLYLAGGIGRRFFTVVDWTQLAGKTITAVINGVSTTKTEGVNWTAATSNAATATSIAAAFNAVAGLDGNITVAVGAVAYFQPAATTWTYQLDLSTNAAAGGGTVTLGANGQINLQSDLVLTQVAGTSAKKVFSVTAPILASGGCTSPTAVTSNGTAAFSIGVGTSCSGSQPLVFTLPAATTGWKCDAMNTSNAATSAPAQTGAVSTTSVTITNFVRTTGVAGAWTNSDNVVVSCMGY